MINDSYEIERGDSGVAFKNSNRIHLDDDLAVCIEAGRVMKAMHGDDAVGVIVWE